MLIQNPVGGFNWSIEKAYKKAKLPYINDLKGSLGTNSDMVRLKKAK